MRPLHHLAWLARCTTHAVRETLALPNPHWRPLMILSQRLFHGLANTVAFTAAFLAAVLALALKPVFYLLGIGCWLWAFFGWLFLPVVLHREFGGPLWMTSLAGVVLWWLGLAGLMVWERRKR